MGSWQKPIPPKLLRQSPWLISSLLKVSELLIMPTFSIILMDSVRGMIGQGLLQMLGLLHWYSFSTGHFTNCFLLPDSRVPKHSATLSHWPNTSVLSNWYQFFFPDEHRIYCRTGAILNFYRYHGSGKFALSASHVVFTPISASQLVTISPMGVMVRAECPAPWTDQIHDLDSVEYDPLEDLYACIQEVFEDLVNSPGALLDQFDLPPDGGAITAQAIKGSETLAVSDGSIDDSCQAVSFAFIISHSQVADAEFLEGANFVT